MDVLAPVTVDEVVKLTASMSLKSSPRDILLTSLLKICISALAPEIAHMANLSFKEGCFPSRFKTAQILPLLKKPSLDSEIFANYRPISNLSTISKMVERRALVRLNPFMTSSPNFNPVQFAYRTAHSTETALIKVFNDVYENVDSRESTVIVALDISAAFDTICHAKCLDRLRIDFGICGVALEWIASHLADRQQYVKIDQHSSTTRKLNSGVSQGSVLAICSSQPMSPQSVTSSPQ